MFHPFKSGMFNESFVVSCVTTNLNLIKVGFHYTALNSAFTSYSLCWYSCSEMQPIWYSVIILFFCVVSSFLFIVVFLHCPAELDYTVGSIYYHYMIWIDEHLYKPFAYE